MSKKSKKSKKSIKPRRVSSTSHIGGKKTEISRRPTSHQSVGGARKGKKPIGTSSEQPTPAPTSLGVAGAVGATAAVGAAAEEARQARLNQLQSQFSDLQNEMALTSSNAELAEMETTLSLMPTELAELRTRGYVFRSFLENKIAVLSEKWTQMQNRVTTEVTRHQRELQRDADAAERALQAAWSGSSTQISQAEGTIQTLESKVRAAQSAISAIYAPLKSNIYQTKQQIEEIKQLLDWIDEASFGLHPAEDPVAACRAQYLEREDEGPEGILFLTDERLIFERKEEVATKKILFITTEKEMVQEMIFEVPIGQIDEMKASDQRKFLRRKEILELFFAPEADLSGATLRLINADNEDWVTLIGRVKSGEIAKERTAPKDEEVMEAISEAPTKCPTCGATLSTEIVRGMREITCEYCGTVIRL